MNYSLETQIFSIQPGVEILNRTPNEITLVYERSTSTLSGAIYQHLISLLNEKYSVSDMVDQLRSYASTSEIYYTFMQLAGLNVLIDENGDKPVELANFWQVMTSNPSFRFKPHLHLETLPPYFTFLLSEREQFTLHGPIYSHLLPLLNGQQDVQEICTLLQDHLSIADIYYIIFRLKERGYLAVVNEMPPSPQVTFWQPAEGVNFEHTTVSVLSLGAVPASSLECELDLLGIPLASDGNLTVVLVDDYLQAELAEFNRQALVTERPWLLVKPVGTILWVGPMFQPTETGCWSCLAHRLRANREIETFIQGQNLLSAQPLSPQVTLPTTLSLGLKLAATEISRWLTGATHQPLANALLTFDLHTLQTQLHPLPQRPQCLVCAPHNDEKQRSFTPLKLVSRKETYLSSGGYRVFPSDQMVDRYAHLVSPVTGIVTDLERLQVTDGSQEGTDLVHVYRANHNFGLNPHNWKIVSNSLKARAMGKGATDSQAKASALAEALERYSGLFHGDEIRQKASYQMLGASAIHPYACLNFSQTQYTKRDQLNATDSRYLTVPEPFDETTEIDWSPVWSLTHDMVKYVPTSYGYYHYPALEQERFCLADSNGSASGGCLEEAILQGFMELVERDGVSLWWYNQLQQPAVDIFSFDEPYLEKMAAYYQSIDRELWVLDLTNDLNIPIFAAVSRRVNAPTEEIIFGFGAHFNPKIGILRAVTEMNQSLPYVLIGANDPKDYQVANKEVKTWWRTATVAQHSYLLPADQTRAKVQADYELRPGDDLRVDVERCVELARQQGLETLVLNQTRPDIGLTVVKVIVPGLRHFWPRFGPGRLYDVPVKLGWLEAQLSEEQLNPQHIFI